MSDKARKEYTVSVELPNGKEDDAYVALFGIIDLLDQIGLPQYDKERVIKTLSIFTNQ